jgi:hypothetical protein
LRRETVRRRECSRESSRETERESSREFNRVQEFKRVQASSRVQGREGERERQTDKQTHTHTHTYTHTHTHTHIHTHTHTDTDIHTHELSYKVTNLTTGIVVDMTGSHLKEEVIGEERTGVLGEEVRILVPSLFVQSEVIQPTEDTRGERRYLAAQVEHTTCVHGRLFAITPLLQLFDLHQMHLLL